MAFIYASSLSAIQEADDGRPLRSARACASKPRSRARAREAARSDVALARAQASTSSTRAASHRAGSNGARY